ncbi:MAG: hypothetical protein GC154_11650 [bacterium]|nr:hypothetical protein [bacterium]
MTRRIQPLLLSVSLLTLSLLAGAHQPFPSYIQHDARLTVSPRNLDLAIRLTGFNGEAKRLRRAIDSNGDGRISPTELTAFSRECESWRPQINAAWNGKTLRWTTLYPASIELNGDDVVSASPLSANLFFFARTPHGNEAKLTVEDRLFGEAPAVITWEADTKPGVSAIVADASGETVKPPYSTASANIAEASRTVEFHIRIESRTQGE